MEFIKITSDGKIELSIEKKLKHIEEDGYPQKIYFQANGDYSLTQIISNSHSPTVEHIFTEDECKKIFKTIKQILIDKAIGCFEKDLQKQEKGGQ